ncbi:MAG: single-stranded DNA-binding protein [Aquificaceae bacterium]
MLNRVLLIGRVVKDAEVITTNTGSKIVSFSIAYNRNYQVEGEWRREAHYFDIKAYGALASDNGRVNKLTRGTLVYVEGRLAQERWMDKAGITRSKIRIVADIIKPLCVSSGKEPQDEDFDNIENPYGDIDFDLR